MNDPESMEMEPPVDLERLLEAVGGVTAEARDLAEFYLAEARVMLASLELAVSAWSRVEIERQAHKLAGASSSCGVTQMLGPLRELEHLARSGQLLQGEACRLYEQTWRQFSDVEAFLASAFRTPEKIYHTPV
jgi:HPt (histidine-containing phosphotransfer) domain-containing protein